MSSLPWAVHLLVGLAMAAGIVIWLSGRRFLKPMVVVLSSAVGASAAMLVVPMLSAATGGAGTGGQAASPLISMELALAIGVIGGAMVGLMMYRSALAVGMGLLLGTLAPMAVTAVLKFHPISEGEAGETFARAVGSAAEPKELDKARQSLTDQMKDLDALRASVMSGRQAPTYGSAMFPEAEGRVREFVGGMKTRVSDGWESMPLSHRGLVIIAGAAGLAGGVLLGLMLPGWAAGGCASMLGAGIWLPSFAWLSQATGAPWRGMLELGPTGWLSIWAAVSVVGMGVQCAASMRRKRRRAQAVVELDNLAEKTRII